MGLGLALASRPIPLVSPLELSFRRDGLLALCHGPLTPAGIALDVLLARPCDCQRAGGDVLGDDRAGGRVGAIADGDGGDERRVHSPAHSTADRGAVLGVSVVVGGDRPRPEVGARSYVGIADVGEVRDLRVRSDVGVLDLDERPDLGALTQEGAGTQVAKGPTLTPSSSTQSTR